MGDPHNPRRANDTWNPERIALQEAEIRKFKRFFTVSGGWAWHFMSPPGHKEYKNQHDHKDVDVFVPPALFAEFVVKAKELGYDRAATLHDNPSGTFYRYTKFATAGKVVFDVYVEPVPYREIDGIKVVEPKHLLSLYEKTHTSKECWAVQAATKLIAEGKDPVDNPALIRDGGK